MPKKPIHDQVVLVTGASAGLGRAVARLAASRGARVVAVARGGDALDATVAELERLGPDAVGVQADVASLDDCQRMVEEAVDRFGRIDTCCANAMVTVYQEARALEPDELRRVVDVNFFGAVNAYWAALPHLTESRGTFVHVSSALAYRGIPLQAAYCSSKAAGRAFFESARVEHAKHGIPVDISLVLPGAINTPQFDTAREYIGKQPQPVPPIYQPEPFAEAVLHCFEHPVRELPVGWGAQKLLWGQKLSPRTGDLVLRRNGWRGQHTGENKPPGSPDNLFEPLPGDRGARGRFSAQARNSTIWTSLRLRRLLVGAAVAGVGLATMGITNSREKPLIR
jgi:NAD(P)-dependent dehydrogenase (short-subunit alcohol dehydrogenase family)